MSRRVSQRLQSHRGPNVRLFTRHQQDEISSEGMQPDNEQQSSPLNKQVERNYELRHLAFLSPNTVVSQNQHQSVKTSLSSRFPTRRFSKASQECFCFFFFFCRTEIETPPACTTDARMTSLPCWACASTCTYMQCRNTSSFALISGHLCWVMVKHAEILTGGQQENETKLC